MEEGIEVSRFMKVSKSYQRGYSLSRKRSFDDRSVCGVKMDVPCVEMVGR